MQMNAWNDAIDFGLFIHKKHVSLYAITCSLCQFDEKKNHNKIQPLCNLNNLGSL